TRRLGKARELRFGHRDAARHGVQHFLAARFDHAARHAFDLRERITSRRPLSGDLQQLLVAHDTERRAVELTSHAVAPGDELAEYGQLAPREIARAFHPQKRIGLVSLRPPRALEQREFLAGPLPPPESL